jgi:hypothetical protein
MAPRLGFPRKTAIASAVTFLLLCNYVTLWIVNDAAYARGMIPAWLWEGLDQSLFAPIESYNGPGKDALQSLRVRLVLDLPADPQETRVPRGQ